MINYIVYKSCFLDIAKVDRSTKQRSDMLNDLLVLDVFIVIDEHWSQADVKDELIIFFYSSSINIVRNSTGQT